MALGTLGIGEQINGVNLGNWLVLEKWMKPGILPPAAKRTRSGCIGLRSLLSWRLC